MREPKERGAQMAPTAFCFVETPIGRLRIAENERGITEIRMAKEDETNGPANVGRHLGAAAQQLREYFAGARRVFDLPLDPGGTAFQQRVWRALCAIPYGETRNYGEIAAAVGSPGASRAVGSANHCNPLLIVVPCHRVIGKNHKLVGYAAGLDRKEYLLALESSRAEK